MFVLHTNFPNEDASVTTLVASKFLVKPVVVTFEASFVYVPATSARTAMLYSHDAEPLAIEALTTVNTPEVADIVEPLGHVVDMFALVSTTRPAGNVSTNPNPVFAALPGLFVRVNISVEI
jgi:hypothetical protein